MSAQRHAVSRGGGGKPNPDPYGIQAAQKGLLGTYDAQMAAANKLGMAKEAQASMMAEHQDNLARQQQEDAAITNAENDIALKHYDEQMTEIGRQLDDVKTRKVDPLKLIHDSPAMGVFAVLAGAVSGFYQGLTHGEHNEFLADLDRQFDRSIAEQERQIRVEGENIHTGINLLGQQRAAQKDDQLAKLQTRNLLYEASKNEMLAEASRAQGPIEKAQADAAMAEIQRGQGQLQLQIAQQKQAQALAYANQAMAMRKEQATQYFNAYKEGITAGLTPAQAEIEGRRAVGIMNGVQVGPRGPEDAGSAMSGMTREQRGKIAMDRSQEQIASDEFNAQIDALLKDPVINKPSLGIRGSLPGAQRHSPQDASDKQHLAAMSLRLTQAAGKVAKDADGKPNIAMMKKIEDTLSPELGETPAMRRQKLNDARDEVNGMARQQGVQASAPGAKAAAKNDLDLKPIGK
jgi:hypothetical protein